MSAATLLERHLLFVDGGLGTTLEDQYGIEFSSDTPLWSSHLLVSSPSTLKQVHTAFAEAGADILLTATYQSSFEGFSKTHDKFGKISRADSEQYMLSAVSLARSSFDVRPGLVALSLGAYGATMLPSTEYSGDYGSMTGSKLIDFHNNRLSVFLNNPDAWKEIDLLAFETLPRLNEIQAVRQVTSSIPLQQRKPYWISCVFPGEENQLPDGASIREVVTALLSGDPQDPPFAIGINCTKVQKLPVLIREFEEAIIKASLPFPRLVLYPDGAANQVYDTKTQQWKNIGHDKTHVPTPWDEEVFEIVKGVQARSRWKGCIVGGCCKTTPLHIARLRDRFDDD